MQAQAKEDFGHSKRRDRKESGATYTPSRLAEAVARRLVSSMGDVSRDRLRILDPGCGDGVLTEALLDQLSEEQRAFAQVTCVDLEISAIAQAEKRLTTKYPGTSFRFIHSDFIDFALEVQKTSYRFDLIIANPPYVRIQSLDIALREKIKENFDLPGRIDLSHPFIIETCDLLSPGGCAGVIVSNRVLSTQASLPVREHLLSSARVTDVWDLGDSKLFEAAVLPAVLFFENPVNGTVGADGAGFTSLYASQDTEGAEPVDNVCADFSCSGKKKLPSGEVFDQRCGKLSTDGTWRLGSDADLIWAGIVQARTWKAFGEVGKVSVGIKTTADKVFISEAWDGERPELARPLVTHHVAGRYKPSGPADREVLYTHEIRDGKRSAVELAKFPVSRAYLEGHRGQLEGRSYVAKAGREWFEIWVPHSPSDWESQKVVFRDIAERPTFWVEEAGPVINGDCYWIKLNEGTDPELIWLMLAVGNSAFIEKFYDTIFNEKLYASRRRFMTRHVKEFPIPDPERAASKKAAQLARRLYEDDMSDETRAKYESKVSALIEDAFFGD